MWVKSYSLINQHKLSKCKLYLLSQVTDILYHIMLYISPGSRFELKTSVVIGTDCIGSCKSNYHTIMATMTSIATSQWFSLGPPVFSTNKTDRHDIIEILLKVALNTINKNTDLPQVTDKLYHLCCIESTFRNKCMWSKQCCLLKHSWYFR
jgi:hypothetical protein